MKRLPSPPPDCPKDVPGFMEKACQNNWNPHPPWSCRSDWGRRESLRLISIVMRRVISCPDHSAAFAYAESPLVHCLVL